MLMDMQPSGEGRLPDHGRVACTACFGGEAVVFDASRTGSTVNQHPKLTPDKRARLTPDLGFRRGFWMG